ncbi:MAG: radical SAM protein [Candidatus Omnitrophota bacterium]
MIKPPPDFRRNTAPYRVFFNWEITYKCNYSCSYCSLGGDSGTKEPLVTIYPGVDRWIEAWFSIYERYGSSEIHFAGGEPFVYPEFMDLIERLSEIHTMEFSTNLFWDPDDFIKRINPGRARVGVSFHPEFTGFDEFFSKALRLKKAGFEVWANYVAYPPSMEGMDRYKHEFEASGILMSILPFRGKHDGKAYPESYTQEERDYLRRLGTSSWTEKTLDFAFDKEKKNNKNRLCRMGQMYAKIHPNGEAYNCCVKNALKLGNIIDCSFSLLENPFLCEEAECFCWRCMLAGNEEHWLAHWPVPPDAMYK